VENVPMEQVYLLVLRSASGTIISPLQHAPVSLIYRRCYRVLPVNSIVK